MTPENVVVMYLEATQKQPVLGLWTILFIKITHFKCHSINYENKAQRISPENVVAMYLEATQKQPVLGTYNCKVEFFFAERLYLAEYFTKRISFCYLYFQII